jgi:hypothetical protein
MNFVQVWLVGYTNRKKFLNELKIKSAPHWGLYATVLRGLMDSILLYLPISVMGRQPPTPSYLTILPTENYYKILVGITPLIFLIQWLLSAAIIHVFLRLNNIPSDMDQVLNITGMASLVIALVLLVWDWFWFFLGGRDQYFLGISHLIIDVWWFVFVVQGLNQILDIPNNLGFIACILSFAGAFPLAVIFMRAPF